MIKEFQEQNGLIADGIIGKKTLEKIMEVLGILTPEHIAHFIGQTSHETGGFKAASENLNYSADRLRVIFPKYFPTPASTIAYARNPEKIASKVYANRMGNGDELSGDGWKYRGRGALQLTGKANYAAFAKFMMDNEILNNPDIVASKYYFQSAFWYFSKNRIWVLATIVNDVSIKTVTKIINGGYNGLEDRKMLTNHFYKIIKSK
jgi:putative chitinase